MWTGTWRPDLVLTPPVGPVNREGETEIEKTAEDVRTLWIDVDGQQERYKEWRALVQERYVERYPDCPLEGPDTVMHLLKHMLRFGGSPRGWLELCREPIVSWRP